MKKFILLIMLLILMTSCGMLSSTTKPLKKSYLTVEVDIPDRGMAISELNKEAISILSKADLSKPVNFQYKRFSGNDLIIFKNSESTNMNPIKIEGNATGYKAKYLITHTEMQLSKLKGKKLVKITAKGNSLSSAIEAGIKNILQKELKEGQVINISGKLNIVNIFNINYGAKDITVDFSIAYTFKDNGKLTPADRANFYAEFGITEYYQKHTGKAYSMAEKGLNTYKKCDKCLYLKGILNLRDKNYDRAIYNLEKAYKYNKDNIYYCQKLQKAYTEVYDLINTSTEQGKQYKKEVQTKAFAIAAYIGRHFNPDGSVYIKHKPPLSSKTLKFKLPKVKNTSLKNGLLISELAKNELPIFNITIAFNFGSVNNPKGKMGMIDSIFDLLKEGVEGKSSKEIANFIDDNGLSLSTGVTNDYSTISCSSLTENSDKCIELLNLLVKKASFPNGEYKKYIKKRVEYYHASTANASYLANKLLYRLVFGKHNYGYYDATLKTLSNIKLNDIKTFYKDYFNPKNAYIVVSGKYSDKILDNIKSKFNNWNSGKIIEKTTKTTIKALKENRQLIYVIDRPSSKQAVISYGQTAPSYSSKDNLPLYIGNLVLGGSASSRLFMRLREKESLTYGAYSSLSSKFEVGLFKAGLSVRNTVVGKAVSSLLDELKKFKEKGIVKKELNDKKGLENGTFAMKLQGFGYLSMLIKSKMFNLPKDYFKNYLSNLSKLTVKDVNTAVKNVITPNKGIIVIVGDSKSFIKQLKPFGQVVVLDENLKVKK